MDAPLVSRSELLLLGGVSLVLASGMLWLTVETWPDVGELAEGPVTDSAFMRTHPGGQFRQQYVPLDRVSPALVSAVLAAEDTQFYRHTGFDRRELHAAAEGLLSEGRARGASTITQQLAKNLYLPRLRTPWGKLREAVLTMQMEERLGKERIIELYLNVAQFGPDAYGVEAAAREFFGTPASRVTPRQAAMLAAGLPRPATWHPGVASEKYARRVDRIMAEVAYMAGGR